MGQTKTYFSNKFNINFLARFLFAIFWILLVLFFYLIYLKINSFQFFLYSGFNQIDTIEPLLDSFSRPFAVGAAALAFLTLGLTASRTARMDKQLIEMQTQREASYQPDIIILRNQFYIHTGLEEKIVPDNAGSHIKVEGDESFLKINNDTDGGKEPNLLLHNIGRGVAKNIKYTFSYPVDEYVTIMKDFNVRKYFNIQLFGETHGSIMTHSSPITAFSGNLNNELSTKHIDYILTVDLTSQTTKILLPYFYILLNFVKDEHFAQRLHEYHKLEDYRELFPKLKFELRFSDISGKSYLNKYEFDITFIKSFPQLLKPDYHFHKYSYQYEIIPIELDKKPSSQINYLA
jgi:hypothetical protein